MSNKKCIVCSNYTGKQYSSCSECKKEDKWLSFAPTERGSKAMRMNQAVTYEQGWGYEGG